MQTIVGEELAALRKTYSRPDLSKSVSDIAGIVYAVHPGNRLPLVLSLLNERPYSSVENFRTGDENISILTSEEEGVPALYVAEGADENAGTAEMTRKHGERVYSLAFETKNLSKLVATLKERGVTFVTEDPMEKENVRYISTTQSEALGITFFYVQRGKNYSGYDFFRNAEPAELEAEIVAALKKKSRVKTFSFIGGMDHLVLSVRWNESLQAARELMRATPFSFDESIDLVDEAQWFGVFRHQKNDTAVLLAAAGYAAESDFEPLVIQTAHTVEDMGKVFQSQKKRSVSFLKDRILGSNESPVWKAVCTPNPLGKDATVYVVRAEGSTDVLTDEISSEF